jgi:predicted DNA-binding protein with PD1-like motif
MTLGHRDLRLSLCLAAAAALSLAGTAERNAAAQSQTESPPSQGQAAQGQAPLEPASQGQASQAQESSQRSPDQERTADQQRAADQRTAGAALPADYIRPAAVQPGRAPSMKVQESSANQRVFEVRFSTGDELLSGLTDLALKNHITAAYVTGIGGLSTGMLGWGDPSNGAFKKIPIDRKAELVSLVGDISMRDGRPYVHLHGVVAFSDGTTRGGHVIEAHIAPVAEIAVVALESGEASTN